jgi:hypothetical protein
MGRARLRGSPPFWFCSLFNKGQQHALRITTSHSSHPVTSSRSYPLFHFSPEMSASPSVRHSFSDIGNLSALMSLSVTDLPTPISEKVAILRPSSPHRDLILIDLSANVNSRTLFVPFTVIPPRLVGPDQSPIFEPEALVAPYLKITTFSPPPGESCQLASGPSDKSFVLNLHSNQSGHSLIVAANSHLIIRSCA